MKNQIVCPANCNGGYANRVISVSQSQAGITPDIARAAKLEPHENLFTCIHCSCVWKENFDSDSRATRQIVLGEFGGPDSATVFQPESRLENAIADLKKESDGVIYGN
jgi:hypothetical protein